MSELEAEPGAAVNPRVKLHRDFWALEGIISFYRGL